jgi:very-short-patch-repair endonuclease
MRSNCIRDDELCTVDGIRCTAAARTAYDLGRRLRGETAVIRIDALLNAARCGVAEVGSIAAHYPGARGVRTLAYRTRPGRRGAESPRETRLRLLLVQSGLRRPVTQIPVANDWGRVVRRIDMGWPESMVGAEYDGEQHFDNPDDYANDIVRLEFLADRGWTIVRVSARQLRYERPMIVARVRRALAAADS